MAHYEDDKIEYIKSDIEKIQRRLGMYISYKGSKGALHLVKEIVNNAIDEVSSAKSPGNKIEISFDEESNQITVIDNGRGIPFEDVELACTKIQSGSKFDMDSTSQEKVNVTSITAGENGVGLTAVNSLSKPTIISIYREGKKGTFWWEYGKLIKKEIVPQTKKDMPHGTTVSFIPGDKYLGKCKIDLKELTQWITYTSYLVDPDIKMGFNIIKKDSNVVKSMEFKHKNGMVDLLETFVDDPIIEPIYINFKGYYTMDSSGTVKFEADNGKNNQAGNKIVLQAAITLSRKTEQEEDSQHISFCNFVNTVDHGVHVNAVRTAWCQVTKMLTEETMTETELKKYRIIFDDSRQCLFFTVNLMCANPQFASQTKEKISNDELFNPIRYITWKFLLKYLKDNPLVLKKVCHTIKQCAKARVEFTSIQKSEYRPIDNLSEHTLKCFSPANDNGYREIFIVEGGSAKGSLSLARDARTQAIFGIRGVPKNSFGLELADILSNQEYKFLIKCLGCGVGKDFNIDHLKYDKIIIFTDSDIDGFRITSLLCTFFLTQYPEIVKAGKLYKAVAPLYIIDDKKHPYILNKIEYYSYFADKIAKIIDLYDTHDNPIKGKAFKDLLVQNNRYLDLLDGLVGNHFINPDIAEFITEYYHSGISDEKFNKLLQKKFPEMSFKKGIAKGVYNFTRQYVLINDEFLEHTKGLLEAIKANGSNDYSFKDSKLGTSMNHVTMGRFLQYTKKYMPKTMQRLKGLGEMDPSDLWKSSLNPATRELIQLNSYNIKAELEKFNILHKKANAQARKELMKDYTLDINDIDN